MTHEFNINLDTLLEKNNIEMNAYTFQKMVILSNAIEDGWTIYKKGNLYFFRKQHEGRREIFNENYLEQFIQKNTNIKP